MHLNAKVILDVKNNNYGSVNGYEPPVISQLVVCSNSGAFVTRGKPGEGAFIIAEFHIVYHSFGGKSMA